MVFLKRRQLTSLSIRARMMGAGKHTSRSRPLRISVLPRVRPKYMLEKKSSKFFRPIHLLPITPLVRE